jgi:hypothetical protein
VTCADDIEVLDSSGLASLSSHLFFITMLDTCGIALLSLAVFESAVLVKERIIYVFLCVKSTILHILIETYTLSSCPLAGDLSFHQPGFTALGHPSSLEIGTTHGVFVLDKTSFQQGVFLSLWFINIPLRISLNLFTRSCVMESK